MIFATAAEYNPFHNGHAYHISQIKKLGADGIIAVMSGSFVQRGEPAVMSKFERAKCAVRNGVDLVLELPVSFSVGSAERFAESYQNSVSVAKARMSRRSKKRSKRLKRLNFRVF